MRILIHPRRCTFVLSKPTCIPSATLPIRKLHDRVFLRFYACCIAVFVARNFNALVLHFSVSSTLGDNNRRQEEIPQRVILSVIDRLRENRTKLLISQYSAGAAGQYDVLLNLTSQVNEAYAKHWGYDYDILRGPPIKNMTWRKYPASRSTYFKVALLDEALRRSYYDRVLLLDSDAMIYDFSRDVASLMSSDKLIVAHKVKRNDSDATGSINIGVTLWNLRHPRMRWLVDRWQDKCVERIRGRRRDDDQAPLQSILKHELSEHERTAYVSAISDEFEYGKGRFIKHFIRLDALEWNETGLDRRVRKIKSAATEVCIRYQLRCDFLNK